MGRIGRMGEEKREEYLLHSLPEASQISRTDVDSRGRIRVTGFLGLCHGSSVRF